MKIIHDIEMVRAICDTARGEGKRVAFVPTMGALHEGHLSLVEYAAKKADFVVVSIFVNPTQFGPGEDFEKYPRDLEKDAALLEPVGASIIFAPSAQSMYSPSNNTKVVVDNITSGLCGASRPTHFEGVATVVTKLFNIIGPCEAVFGKKDYQQLQVIKALANDLNMPVVVTGMPTVREKDGLAKSSRNEYLLADERKKALCLSSALIKAHEMFDEKTTLSALKKEIKNLITDQVDSVDYIGIADPQTLSPLVNEKLPSKVLIALAVKIGTTRLIDNTVLGEDTKPLF